MSEGEIYCVMNLEKYADFVRKKAASSFAENYNDNIDEFITIQQACSFVEENSIGKDEKDRFLLDDKSYEELYEAIRLRIYNAGLSKLASKNMIECAWDANKNKMIFWNERN